MMMFSVAPLVPTPLWIARNLQLMGLLFSGSWLELSLQLKSIHSTKFVWSPKNTS